MPARTSNTKAMSNEARLLKNKQIKEAGIATRARRASMTVKVYELKIVESKLNKTQKKALKEIFLEYKWIRNAAVAAERFDLGFVKELNGVVPVVTPNAIEEREIRWLGSQMQQGVITELKRNLKALSVLKGNGRKTGRLKFIRNAKSIDLQQYRVTYELYGDNGRITKARVQNIPGRLRVRGGEQLDREDIEFANAKLVRKPDGFYLKVTCYLPSKENEVPSSTIGVDFGVKDNFTLSTGEAVSSIFEEPERLKRLQRKLSRQTKNSNGYRSTQAKIQREYLRVSYKKEELARQLVSSWTASNVVYFQDEMISSWKRRGSGSHGSKKVHHGVLGRVKTLLRRNHNSVMLPAWMATTAWCPACGNRTAHELSKRNYNCACGYVADRDVHAARNMVILGERFSILTSGTEGSAGGGNIRLKKALYAAAEQFPAKPETATASVSP